MKIPTYAYIYIYIVAKCCKILAGTCMIVVHCIIIILCRLAHFVICYSLPAHWCSGRPPGSSSPDCDRGTDIIVCSLLSTLSVKEGVST